MRRRSIMYVVWVDARVFSKKFDSVTKKLLEDLLWAAENAPELAHVFGRNIIILTLRIHLSLVLQQMGVEPEAQRR